MSDSDLVKRSTSPYAYGRFQASRFSAAGETVIEPWHSEEGKRRLDRSRHREAFFRLAGFYQAQINPLYCGVASAVMVLNALRLPRDRGPAQPELAVVVPESPEALTIEFRAYVQATLLGPRTDHVKARAVVEYLAKNAAGVFRPGLSLEELRGILEAHGAQARSTFAAESETAAGIDGFRELVKDKLGEGAEFVIMHFRSDLVGGIPRGHISPLAAYDETSDSVLVLDVAGHKGPWYWAPVAHLFQAMQATYDTQPRGGGYLVVCDPRD